jgi:serine/threonine-protein kinase RsbW
MMPIGGPRIRLCPDAGPVHAGGPSGPAPAALDVRNTRPELEALERRVLEAMSAEGYPDASRFAVRLALEEALVNAFMHGHRGLPPDTPVRVAYSVTPESVSITVEDRGPGFDPASVADPTLSENLELPSGRGLMLIRAFMTEVRHESNGKRLIMVYRRPDPAGTVPAGPAGADRAAPPGGSPGANPHTPHTPHTPHA